VAVVADQDLVAAVGQGLARDPAAADADLDVDGPDWGSGDRHGTRLLDRGGSGLTASWSTVGVVMQIGHLRPRQGPQSSTHPTPAGCSTKGHLTTGHQPGHSGNSNCPIVGITDGILNQVTTFELFI
jgi:hypothetical protein